MKSIFALALLSSSLVLANDGFYQGSGYHLTPVKNQDLRVVSETLEIRPITPPACYTVLYQGKPVNDDQLAKMATANKSAFSIATKKGECPGTNHLGAALWTQWRAEAHYEITALQEAKDVLIGFPVPEWEYEFDMKDGLDGVSLPGAMGFHTSVNGKPIRHIEAKGLKITVPPLTREEKKPFEVPGYAWRTSFEAGKKYSLQTDYDFGVDLSTGYYEGREYPAGQAPWFGTQLAAEIEHMRYFLTPMRTWASPAPASVFVRIFRPKAIPVTYLIPVDAKPGCVDESGYVYKYENAFPEHDVDITYPGRGLSKDAKELHPIRTEKEWNDWLKSIGGATAPVVACALRDQVARDADASAKAAISATKCLESCGK